MNTDEILNRAKELIQQRAVYGEFDITAMRTARMQTILHEEPRSPEGWLLDMVTVKLCRWINDKNNADHLLDAICYLAEAASFATTNWDDLDERAK